MAVRKLFRKLRCLFRGHRWEIYSGGGYGAKMICMACGKKKDGVLV